jgi:hypothetical protein
MTLQISRPDRRPDPSPESGKTLVGTHYNARTEAIG